MSSELIERLREKNEWTNQKPYFHAHPKSLEAADLIEAQAATIAALQAELAEARDKALDEAAGAVCGYIHPDYGRLPGEPFASATIRALMSTKPPIL